MTLLEFAVLLVVSTVSALAVLFLLAWRRPAAMTDKSGNEPAVALLFEGETLADATPHAQTLIEGAEGSSDWKALRAALIDRFPNLPADPPENAGAPVEYGSCDTLDAATVRIVPDGRHARVELHEPLSDTLPLDTMELRRLRRRVGRLEEACATSPFPMWRTNEDGRLVWSNTAYQTLASAAVTEKDTTTEPILHIDPQGRDHHRARATIERSDRELPAWYDVSTTAVANGRLFHAANIDAVIQAEIAQRNFVQTLAKTFAQLSIGLAIFDRNGQLALFNPALVDLTHLPPEFLSARPDLLSFFDRLRDSRAMPEPKNYANWRQEISQMIAAANDGRYQETWSLDSGQTYRVTGRPHPDGAVAFLIEDISAEISLTRNFRAELELGQSLLDTFEDGLAVFSSAGVLTFCNRAYRDLWKVDPDNSFADITIIDCIRVWQEQCKPNPAWGDIRDYVMKIGERAPWEAWVTRKDGLRLYLTIAPIASGATALRFDQRAKTLARSEADGA